MSTPLQELARNFGGTLGKVLVMWTELIGYYPRYFCIRALSKQGKVVILLDEYDAPIINKLRSDKLETAIESAIP